MDYKALVAEAFAARKAAYAPYSHFLVGAALLTSSGKIYRGCNIENAAYTPTNCAERTAFFHAVSEGERSFAAIAVVGAPEDTSASDFCETFPCGVCRQVMMEFCTPEEFVIVTAQSPEKFRTHTLKELLPEGFGPESLG